MNAPTGLRATTAAAPTERSPNAVFASLVDAASARYRASDGHAVRFARAKLGGDRVFRHVLAHGLIEPGAQVFDVGCGQGLLANLLVCADAAARGGHWPVEWARAPLAAKVTGIDPLAHDLHRAEVALGGEANFVRADMRRFDFTPCDAVVFFDSLHYIARAEQDEVLQRVRHALRPGGVVLLRVGDASARGRFALGQWIDRLTMLVHGGGFGPLFGRPLAAWLLTLERLGFRTHVLPMHGRPPFANLLIVARLPRA